jgi:hypothetical protein
MSEFADTQPERLDHKTVILEDWEIRALQEGWKPPKDYQWGMWCLHCDRPGGTVAGWTKEKCEEMGECVNHWNETVLGRPPFKRVTEVIENNDETGENIITWRYDL